MNALFDRKGRQVMVGDVLKVFHFFGPRRQRFYMYKHVEALVVTKGKNDFLKISHLGTKPEHYMELMDGTQRRSWEIVQGYGPDGTPFDQRKKWHPTMPEHQFQPAERE